MYIQNKSCQHIDEKGEKLECEKVWKVFNGGRDNPTTKSVRCSDRTCPNQNFVIEKKELKSLGFKENEKRLVLVFYLLSYGIKDISSLTNIPEKVVGDLFVEFDSGEILVKNYKSQERNSVSRGTSKCQAKFTIRERSPNDVTIDFEIRKSQVFVRDSKGNIEILKQMIRSLELLRKAFLMPQDLDLIPISS